MTIKKVSTPFRKPGHIQHVLATAFPRIKILYIYSRICFESNGKLPQDRPEKHPQAVFRSIINLLAHST